MASAWYVEGNLLVRRCKWTKKKLVIGFDLDNTLIVTKSGNTFAIDENDWKWRYDIAPDVLRELLSDGYGVVIFSNQKNCVGKKQEVWKTKLDKILKGLDVLVLCAIADDEYRKPNISMWTYMEKLNGQKATIKGSWFIGDAAGRLRDFSDSDKIFAKNIGIDFETPEWLFESNKKDVLVMGSPEKWRKLGERIGGPEDGNVELLILVGSPASGKSTLCEKLLAEIGFERVCQDELGTKEKCMKKAKELLSKDISVVVDATNPSKSVRAEWIALAKEFEIHIRAIVLETSSDIAKKMNRWRGVCGGRQVPDIAFAMYYKHYEPVEEKEGFSEVIRTPPLIYFEDQKEKERFLAV